MNFRLTSILHSALFAFASAGYSHSVNAQEPVIISSTLEQKVIEWRRDFHQHPELSNREFRTSKVIEAHLLELGLEEESALKTGTELYVNWALDYARL